ncbi:MAG: YihY/virulence factor BrkB family protein [Deltaproteobacteria bacterium]|nr:YihY/virulence factor BrkB family protein [Deltaproteobacteria bacterium]
MKRLYAELKHIAVLYRKHDCFNLAAALSFYAILSILPILLIVISLAGHYVGQSDILLEKTGGLIESVVPSLKTGLVNNIKTIVEARTRSGWFGVLLLFFVAHFMFANLEHTVNRLLSAREKRHFLITRLLFLVWLMGLSFLLCVPALVNIAQTMVERWGFSLEFSRAFRGNEWFFIVSVLSFVMMILLVPTQKVPLGDAVLGGLIFGFLLQIARWLFQFYTLTYFHRYNLIYGSLTTLIIGAFWIFYFSNILLLCVLWVGERQKRR